jgi:HK97 family phage prohead protease
MANLPEIDFAGLYKDIREVELEQLESYRKGVDEAPVLYRQEGYVVNKVADAEGLFDFVASEESKDRMSDVIRAGGWELKNFRKNPVMLFGHNHNLPVIGRVGKVDVVGKQLLASQARFDMEDPFAAAIAGKYDRGFMRAVSVGFRPLEFAFMGDDSGGVDFKSQELLEISTVGVPAHPAALKKALAVDAPFRITNAGIPNLEYVQVGDDGELFIPVKIRYEMDAPIAEAKAEVDEVTASPIGDVESISSTSEPEAPTDTLEVAEVPEMATDAGGLEQLTQRVSALEALLTAKPDAEQVEEEPEISLPASLIAELENAAAAAADKE